MENVYSVGLKNRYDIFYSEEVDPVTLINQHHETKEKPKKINSRPKLTESENSQSPGQPNTGESFSLRSSATGTDKSKNLAPRMHVDHAKVHQRETKVADNKRNAQNFGQPCSTNSWEFKGQRSFRGKNLVHPRETRVVEDKRYSHNSGKQFSTSNFNRGGFKGQKGSRDTYNTVSGPSHERDGDDDVAVVNEVKYFSEVWSDVSDEINPKTRRKETDNWIQQSEQKPMSIKELIDSEWSPILSFRDKVMNWINDPEYEALSQMKQLTLDEQECEQSASGAIPKQTHRKITGRGSNKGNWKNAQVPKQKVEAKQKCSK